MRKLCRLFEAEEVNVESSPNSSAMPSLFQNHSSEFSFWLFLDLGIPVLGKFCMEFVHLPPKVDHSRFQDATKIIRPLPFLFLTKESFSGHIILA